MVFPHEEASQSSSSNKYIYRVGTITVYRNFLKFSSIVTEYFISGTQALFRYVLEVAKG